MNGRLKTIGFIFAYADTMAIIKSVSNGEGPYKSGPDRC